MMTNKIVKKNLVPINLQDSFTAGLTALATLLSNRAITPANLTTAYEMIRSFAKSLAQMEELAKKLLKNLVLTTGTKVENQILLTVGETVITCRPINTKLDSKKVESMLRAKNLSIDKGMDQEISYKINESKLNELVTRNKITADELEACRHELTYSLQPPKRINEASDVSND